MATAELSFVPLQENFCVVRLCIISEFPPAELQGAVMLCVAKSWFRIGSLEILTHYGELDLLRMLLDFIIQEYFPLVDGVCNTDNFSLLSITIDYGPFGFMEAYNPNFVPNTSADERRYKIGNQANIGMFNLNKLLKVLNPLLNPRQKQLCCEIIVYFFFDPKCHSDS
ncbi:protein adenylyltransferase SelO-like isoform X2 [Odocoileus virginianus]|uniref:Selenoprotein O n=1 Tax=Odocoileus virginianus TaxID=9874 RepID=A0ABM4IJV3_ODOVR